LGLRMSITEKGGTSRLMDSGRKIASERGKSDEDYTYGRGEVYL